MTHLLIQVYATDSRLFEEMSLQSERNNLNASDCIPGHALRWIIPMIFPFCFRNSFKNDCNFDSILLNCLHFQKWAWLDNSTAQSIRIHRGHFRLKVLDLVRMRSCAACDSCTSLHSFLQKSLQNQLRKYIKLTDYDSQEIYLQNDMQQ